MAPVSPRLARHPGLARHPVGGLATRTTQASSAAVRSVDERCEHLGPLPSGGVARVAEHAVGGHCGESLGRDDRTDLSPAGGRPRLETVRADAVGVEVQQHRRLGPTGMAVAARHPRVPHQHVAALGREQRLGARQRLDVAAVAVHQDDPLEGPGPVGRKCGSGELHHERLECQRADGERSGEALVLPGGPDGDRRCDHDPVPLRSERIRQVLRDAQVDVEGQMGAVLLAAADGHHQQQSHARGPRSSSAPPDAAARAEASPTQPSTGGVPARSTGSAASSTTGASR